MISLVMLLESGNLYIELVIIQIEFKSVLNELVTAPTEEKRGEIQAGGSI